MIRLLSELILTAGVLANLARDMRNLQRTEIGEVGEEFSEKQVGSSTMPQKRNPINFENVESLWKILVGRLSTIHLDQISEHQRDLTNSASSRTHPEIVGYLVSMTKRLTKIMAKLNVDHDNLKRNFAIQQGLIVSEPLQVLLSALGHPEAHEKVKNLTLQSQREHQSFEKLVGEDPELKPYIEKMTPFQKSILSNPSLYIGIASQKTNYVIRDWAEKLDISLDETRED
jgi:adenylosuccinate lyase